MRLPFPLIAFFIGLLLIGLGLLAYFGFATGEDRSWTALIPLFWGVPIVLCVFASAGSVARRRHAMHLVAVLALLGFLAPLGRLIPTSIKNGFHLDSKSWTQIGMSLLCIILLVFAIRSCIAARRARKAAS